MLSFGYGLWISLLVVFLLQAIFFLFAARFKTDKVTDLSYGLTFVVISLFLLLINPDVGAIQWIFFILILLWGTRLSVYLFTRILKIKKDSRFDGIRERFLSFAKFWVLQGLSIWIILLPITSVLILKDLFYSFVFWAGILIWLVGFITESVADYQKSKFYNTKESKTKWIATGLWKYSRHPNYFGEILCWWGIFIAATPYLSGWTWVSVLSPLWITYLLIYVTGLPPLEKKADEKYMHNSAYEKYKKRTSSLIPLPLKKSK
ncbi:MAG: DUF1295 domain-containing protein [Candidatus Nanoarchaeia archaeon]